MQQPPDTQTLHNGTTFRMIHVPGTGQGTYLMGSNNDDVDPRENEQPAHPVRLSDFWIGETAVRQAVWTAVMGENPSQFKGEEHPVESITWFQTLLFCNKLSVDSGAQPCYRHHDGRIFGRDSAFETWHLPEHPEDIRCNWQADGYRLPTEAEWEYAARGGQYAIDDPARGGLFAGSDHLDQVGWYNNNSDNQTHEVALRLPNALGLYDMSGNIWEWCWDAYEEKYYQQFKNSMAENPNGPAPNDTAVLRGGSYNNNYLLCRAALRYWINQTGRSSVFGFRLARCMRE